MRQNRSQNDALNGRLIGRASPRWRLILSLGCLVVVGLAQTGCRSNGCSNCNLGSRLNNGVQALNARIFPKRGLGGNCSTCGTLGGVEEGVIVDSGVPIVTPGAVAIPAPATIIPSPSIESAPRLEPIPSGPVGEANAGSSNRAQAGASRSAYEAMTPVSRVLASRPGTDLSRAYQAATASVPTTFAPLETDVFDHLPPVDLPPDFSRKSNSIDPVPALPTSDAPPPITPAQESSVQSSSVEHHSTGDTAISNPKQGDTGLVPGQSHSASVAPLLAGGGLPNKEGLVWLKEKGYRTLVDLRSGTEVEPAFPDRVTESGLLYVAVPFVANPISMTRFSRFLDVIRLSDQRPLYFCDGDGRRAGLLWYLKLRYQDHESPESARLRAEEIGFQAADSSIAERFLQANLALEPLPIYPLTVLVAPVTEETLALGQLINPPGPTFDETATLGRTRSDRSSDSPSLIASWKPVTALVLSGLGVPLAYWSRGAFWQNRSSRRASLTVREPRPRKFLTSSDA